MQRWQVSTCQGLVYPAFMMETQQVIHLNWTSPQMTQPWKELNGPWMDDDQHRGGLAQQPVALQWPSPTVGLLANVVQSLVNLVVGSGGQLGGSVTKDDSTTHQAAHQYLGDEQGQRALALA